MIRSPSEYPLFLSYITPIPSMHLVSIFIAHFTSIFVKEKAGRILKENACACGSVCADCNTTLS